MKKNQRRCLPDGKKDFVSLGSWFSCVLLFFCKTRGARYSGFPSSSVVSLGDHRVTMCPIVIWFVSSHILFRNRLLPVDTGKIAAALPLLVFLCHFYIGTEIDPCHDYQETLVKNRYRENGHSDG